jgi:hypothetical protein
MKFTVTFLCMGLNTSLTQPYYQNEYEIQRVFCAESCSDLAEQVLEAQEDLTEEGHIVKSRTIKGESDENTLCS